MNYAEMSDFEINKAVAFHIGLSTVIAAENLEFNPCNSWADAGPIIEQSRIGIEHDGDCWLCICFSENGAFQSEHDNPLRAAMITYLMMTE